MHDLSRSCGRDWIKGYQSKCSSFLALLNANNPVNQPQFDAKTCNRIHARSPSKLAIKLPARTETNFGERETEEFAERSWPRFFWLGSGNEIVSCVEKWRTGQVMNWLDLTPSITAFCVRVWQDLGSMLSKMRPFLTSRNARETMSNGRVINTHKSRDRLLIHHNYAYNSSNIFARVRLV